MAMRPRVIFLPLIFSLTCSYSYSENLYQIYQDAVENDFTMKGAKASLRADSEAYNQALAKYLPQVGLDGSVTYSTQDSKRSGVSQIDYPNNIPAEFKPAFDTIIGTFNGINQSHTNTDQTNSQWNVVLQQELINMPYWYGIKSSDHMTKVAELNFFNAQQDLIIRAANAYLGVLKAQNNLESSTAEEAAYKQQLDQTRQRFKVGLVANTDVQEAQAAYDLSKVQRITDQGSLQTSFEALTVLTGKYYNYIAPLSTKLPITLPTPNDMDSWVALAKSNNPLLNIKRETADSAKYNAKAASAARYPTLSLSASYGRSHIDSNIDNNIQNDAVGVTLQVPIYTGGQLSSKIRENYARYDYAMDDMGATERQITQQTRSAYIQTLTTIQTVKARKQSIVSAQSALNAVQAGYEYGTKNILDVLQAVQTLHSAKRDYGNSRYDYILSILKMKQLGGALTPEDIVTINHWIIEPKAKTTTRKS